jgi:hypothetical protein
MTTSEIANRLYELCQKGDFNVAQEELYATDATSTERNMEGVIETVTGMNAIVEKGKQFRNSIEEVHSGYTNEPKVFGTNIFMEMGMDVTMKGMGRMNMNEMCRYETKDGKITSEQFYY